MIVKAPQLARAISQAAQTRLLLFYGPDEAGSRALLDRVTAALGDDSERVDLVAAELRGDPARLRDEAAAISMFGGSRYILVERAGDEILSAVEALLAADVAGNPVIVVAGDLKKSSKLLKAAADSALAVAFASYVPDGGKADQLVLDKAPAYGLIAQRDVARRIADGCSGNRAVIDQELGKYALFLDASPDSPKTLTHEAVDAIGAGTDEGDLSRLVDGVASGDAAAVESELVRLRSEGVEGISLIRAMLRRMSLLARLRAEVEQGNSPAAVMASTGKSLFWKEKEPVGRQLARWRSELIAKSVSRLIEAERQVKAPGGLGPIAADEELFAICRQAARLR
ncbi:MAG TPA: DNA polymerase III subunit delta [Allosphingosinicella sp.]|nr:DNA polymerase III subunit delta [Allosphingosinicella sp.]